MKITEKLFDGYENMRMLGFDECERDGGNIVAYRDISSYDGCGVLKGCDYAPDGTLRQLYTKDDNHVGVIAATRLGKTSSYVIPSVISFARQKRKRSMIISDPKGEIYRHTAQTLRAEGYNVRLINFRDYTHSECWNVLTPIYRKYQAALHVEDEVKVTTYDGVERNLFRGKVYFDQKELDSDIAMMKSVLMSDVGNDIDDLARMLIVTYSQSDPYWENSARDLFKAFLWAMLEDSADPKDINAITEETFSFSTILRLATLFEDGRDDALDDKGYFSRRPNDSMAYMLAKNIILCNARTTRRCIISSFMVKMSVFQESAVRLLTSCNSFEMRELTEGPVAVFIDYRDEVKAHFQLISLFVQEAYRLLIDKANDNRDGKLDVPFYFILDEFGNFPAINDFETTISACAGRNIFFILIMQSYAQLYAVYGKAVSEIIRDNLNVHVFFGSNNPETLESFSCECGQRARISPLSALNGTGARIDAYQIESVPLVPKSRLSALSPGECIITEANSGHVLFSRLRRYFMCEEFDLPLCSAKEYEGAADPFNKRYVYNYRVKFR